RHPGRPALPPLRGIPKPPRGPLRRLRAEGPPARPSARARVPLPLCRPPPLRAGLLRRRAAELPPVAGAAARGGGADPSQQRPQAGGCARAGIVRPPAFRLRLEIVKAVRDGYDGAKRNPWDEVESGRRYA